MRDPAVWDRAPTERVVRRSDLGLSSPLEYPNSEIEIGVAQIWQDVLSIDAVGLSDDFFELGGDSFAATAIVAEIESMFGVHFAPGALVELSTVGKQAKAIAKGRRSISSPPPFVVIGKSAGSKPPLFMVHGAAGFSFFNRNFLDEAGEDRPIYLFQVPGLDGRMKPLQTVEAIADAYIGSMRTIQPAGPYNIVGMCTGCLIAVTMCNQLTDAALKVGRLILLDPPPIPHALARQYSAKNKWPYRRLLGEDISSWLYEVLLRVRRLRHDDDPYARELKQRAKRQKRENTIRRRREGLIDSALPEEQSYSPERMLEASMQLNEALKRCVPRPYRGKASILVRSTRAHETLGPGSFWRQHIGEIDGEVAKGTHRQMFSRDVLETARFVRQSLEIRG